MAIKQLSDGNPDGTVLGQSTTDTIAFYGVTPVDQPASANQTAVTITATSALATTTISQVATSGKWAFANGTVAALYVTRIKQMQVDVEALGVLVGALRLALVSNGLIKGAA